MTQQVEKLSETNKSLAQKIKKFLSDLLAKVKEIYSRLSADSEESKIVSQMSDTLSDIIDKWSQGIINASKNADTVTGKSQTKNTVNNDGVRFDIKRTINMSWEDQINDYFDKKSSSIKHSDTLVVMSNTPGYISDQTINDLPIALPLSIITKAQKGKNSSHTVTERNIKKLQKGIEAPVVAVYDKNRNSMFIVTNLKQKRLPVCVSLELNTEFDGDSVHKTTSVHIRQDISKYFNNLSGTKIFVLNKNELVALCREADILDRLQSNNELIDAMISHKDAEVKDENQDIRFSKRLIDAAAEHFGTTYSWKETGYLLTDGRKLDFSGRKFGSNARYRTIDHREIWDGFSEEDQEQFESGSEAMVHFMQQGNIRIMPESDGINLSVAPTKAQESALSDYITRANGEILLDIDDLQGNTKVSVEYPSGTKTSKIINDIRQYFTDGTEPYVSSIQEFRYSRRYADIDLNTLDDNELRVYNNRGWASDLFTKEDHKLLQEKFNELNNKTTQKTDNVLSDGSRVVEVNNKLVLISGTFKEPIIHNVLVINANNETDAEIIKEVIYNASSNYRQNRQRYSEFCSVYQSVVGFRKIRNYESADFSHYKGRKDTGERAVLPDTFKSYGYTKQFTERTGSNTETETYLSAYNQIGEKLYQTRPDFDGETKYQARPVLEDFLFDDEYNELTDNDAYLIGQYITGDALTVNHLINNTRKTELSDSALNHIVSKLVKSYNLDSSNNKDISIALLSYIFYIY